MNRGIVTEQVSVPTYKELSVIKSENSLGVHHYTITVFALSIQKSKYLNYDRYWKENNFSFINPHLKSWSSERLVLNKV